MDASIRLDRLPASGETVLGESVRYIPGGKGANQAVAAGRLAKESEVSMIGCVGGDRRRASGPASRQRALPL